MENEKKPVRRKRQEMLPERLMKGLLEGFGEAVDRRLGRTADTGTHLTTTALATRMTRLIDERVRDEGARGRIAPHVLKLKVEWGTHSEAPAELIKELETELLASAIDHINDCRYRTLAPVRVETEVDIFTSGISVDPTFGEFAEQLAQEDEARRRAEEFGVPDIPKAAPHFSDVPITARALINNFPKEFEMVFTPGGRRHSVGRGTDNSLCLSHASVSKIHATMMMNRDGTLFVADAGSTNGTFINGRRIGYGEARQIEDGDVVGFGDIEVRFKKD
jgi:hypothetical protein